MFRTCLIGCLFLLLPSQLPAQFQPHVDYATGTYPFSVAVGDFNGDGKLDLAATNSTSNTVSVLTGNGDGTFQAHVDYATGNRPLSLVVGDFSRDGKLDLAITNATDNTVGLLLGNGDSTFQPHVDYPTELNPQWLVAADFNGDGKLDLATANYGPDYSNGTVSIFLGNGDGTFHPQTAYAGGVNPFGVMAGDFNRDGKPDLAVVNNNGGWGVSILLGTGDGSFQPPVNYATGRNPRVGVVADFNGDGNLDLAVGNCIDNDLSILLGDGAGHFSTPVNYAVGAWVNTLAGGDFDGDGRLDLVNVNSQSDNVSVLMGNGDGTFQEHVDFATGSSPAWVAVGDLNGDGAPDLVTANIYVNSVSVLLNTSNPRFTTTTLVSSRNPAAPYQRVTYTATVTSEFGRGNTGTVTFRDGGQNTATVTLANHQAAFSTTYSAIGTHPITATYSGDADSNGSTSSTLAQYIQDNTKTLLTTSGSPSFVGQPVTFTATVVSRYGTIPDGEPVTFYDGPTMLGTVALSGSTAAYTTSSLAAKTHSIKAIYDGDGGFMRSSGAVTQVVSKYPTRTALRSRHNPSAPGQVAIFTVKVTSAGSATPTGKVRFMDGAFAMGTATLNGGIAEFARNKLTVGTHPMTAEYLGDSVSAKSTSSVLYQVVQ